MNRRMAYDKWLVMGLLITISILVGLVPYLLFRYTKSGLHVESSKYNVVLTILSCFGAGALLSTALLHLLPEVRESFHQLPFIQTTFDDHFPIAEAVVICGFCLIYIVEEIAQFIMVDGHHEHGHHRFNSVLGHNSLPNVQAPITLAKSSMISQAKPSQHLKCTHVAKNSSNKTSKHHYEEQQMISINESAVTNSIMDRQCSNDKDKFTSALRTFIAMIALSFHAVMEGVAIGLQESSGVWMMFGAVSSHKFVISFCMGMELVACQTRPKSYIASITSFAVLSPVGIIVGSLLTTDGDEIGKGLSVTIIKGLACGTLVYVVFFEILNRERERKNRYSNSKTIGFIQFLALVVGLVAMGCLLTLVHIHGEEIVDIHNHN